MAARHGEAEALRGVRDSWNAFTKVLNTVDAAPLTTIAAVHGVASGEVLSWLWHDLINRR